MNVVLLIDQIVRQTTVLIAQLSTAAGIRAPLADLADQVFLKLASEIEAQGVPRKVVADMFGLALRSYQRKVQRITESATETQRTLWQAVLDHLTTQGSCTRQAVIDHFHHDDPDAVAAVLSDLFRNGLVYKTGAGRRALYGATREQEYSKLIDAEDLDAAAALVWLLIHRQPGLKAEEVSTSLGLSGELSQRALQTLVEQGRVVLQDGGYRTDVVTIPVGAGHGWEAAVFDHYQAMVTAIGKKVSSPRSSQEDVVGGATLVFDVHEGHPHQERVYQLLSQVRTQVSELWDEVRTYNQEHPVPDERKQRVAFYFGQSVTLPEELPDETE
jgi:hypothetical protein